VLQRYVCTSNSDSCEHLLAGLPVNTLRLRKNSYR
jgi:hypothetical protein